MKKENPLFKNEKRIKSINVGSDEEDFIKKFIIIVGIIIVLVGAVYYITEHAKKSDDIDTNTEAVEINYDIVTIGMLLNRPEKEYYVIIYDENDDDAILYSSMISNYKIKGNLKLYYCNLDNKLNSAYYNVNNDNKSNPKATKIKELDLGDLTLIKVKNGKIVKYIEKYEEIKTLLK